MNRVNPPLSCRVRDRGEEVSGFRQLPMIYNDCRDQADVVKIATFEKLPFEKRRIMAQSCNRAEMQPNKTYCIILAARCGGVPLQIQIYPILRVGMFDGR
jgi:hypothetical protein